MKKSKAKLEFPRSSDLLEVYVKKFPVKKFPVKKDDPEEFGGSTVNYKNLKRKVSNEIYESALEVYLDRCELTNYSLSSLPLSERPKRVVDSIKKRLNDKYVNILIAGGHGAGKTSFTEQFIKGTYSVYSPSNFNVNYIKTCKCLGITFDVLLTDTCANGELTSFFPKLGIKEADIIIIILSVVEKDSPYACIRFLENYIDIVRNVKDLMEYQYYNIIVLANKIDLLSTSSTLSVVRDEVKSKYMDNYECIREKCLELDIPFQGCTCINTTVVEMTMQKILARYISGLPFTPTKLTTKVKSLDEMKISQRKTEKKKKKKKKKKGPSTLKHHRGSGILSRLKFRKK